MTLVSDYARAVGLRKSKSGDWWEEATNLPLNATHCSMNKRFCGSCIESPPCLSASSEELKSLVASEGQTSTWPCKLCTEEMRIRWCGEDRCCCWGKASRGRIERYKQWEIKYNRDNVLTTERRKVYGKKRQKSTNRAKEDTAKSICPIVYIKEGNNETTVA